jgi:hypothetical protein
MKQALLGWDALYGTEVKVQVQFRPPTEGLIVLVVEGVLGKARLRLGICDALAFRKLRLLGGQNLDLKRLVVYRHGDGAFQMWLGKTDPVLRKVVKDKVIAVFQ